MAKLKLYAMAVFAFKPDPSQTVTEQRAGAFSFKHESAPGDNYFNMSLDLRAGVELTVTWEEAIDNAMDSLKEICPESEGWTSHRAYYYEIPDDLILRAAASIEANMIEGDKEESVM